MTATLDANGASGLRLAIYTPDQITAWQNGEALTPIGVGSPSPATGHDLLWTGPFNTAGTYYAVVSNDSDASVTVSLNVTGDLVVTTVNVLPTPTPFPNPFATVTPLGTGFSGQLVFQQAAGGTIYRVNGDGTNLQPISFGLDPQWNRAGTQVALARQGPVPGIYTLNPDGSQEQLLYQTNEPRAPDWSPDGSRIVFSFQGLTKGGVPQTFTFRGRTFTFASPETVQWKVATVSAAGGDYLDLKATNHAYTPSWNADGVTIAFNDLSVGIMQTSVNGDYAPFNFIGDLRQGAADYNPLKLMSEQYSPDGKQMVYMVMQQPAWQIAVANADGSNQHLLTRIDPLDFVHPNNFAPIWSPDGKQILFLSDRNKKIEFFLMNADGSGQVQVLKNVSDQVPLFYEYESERMMTWTR